MHLQYQWEEHLHLYLDQEHCPSPLENEWVSLEEVEKAEGLSFAFYQVLNNDFISKLIQRIMNNKLILSLSINLLFIFSCHADRVAIWPEGKIPDFQSHQIAATNKEVKAKG